MAENWYEIRTKNTPKLERPCNHNFGMRTHKSWHLNCGEQFPSIVIEFETIRVQQNADFVTEIARWFKHEDFDSFSFQVRIPGTKIIFKHAKKNLPVYFYLFGFLL